MIIKKNTCWKKQLKRDNIGQMGKSKRFVSLFWFCSLFLLIFAGFSGRSYKTVTAEQGFCCVFTKRHKTPIKAFRSLQVRWYDVAIMRSHGSGLLPNWVQLWLTSDLCLNPVWPWYVHMCTCWREGPAVLGCVCLDRVESKKKLYTISRTCVSNKWNQHQ